VVSVLSILLSQGVRQALAHDLCVFGGRGGTCVLWSCLLGWRGSLGLRHPCWFLCTRSILCWGEKLRSNLKYGFVHASLLSYQLFLHEHLSVLMNWPLNEAEWPSSSLLASDYLEHLWSLSFTQSLWHIFNLFIFLQICKDTKSGSYKKYIVSCFPRKSSVKTSAF
jgi:hypothetical protein